MKLKNNETLHFSIGDSFSEELVLLLNRNFKYQLSNEELIHYCAKGPFGKNRFYLMTSDEGELVGCFGVLPVEVFVRGSLKKLGYANYLSIDKRFRSVSSFQALSNFVFKSEMDLGTLALYGPPNQSGYQAHTKLTGWRIFSELDLMIKKPSFEPFNEYLNYVDFTTSQVSEELLNGSSIGYDFALSRNLKWMRWRYNNFPRRSYDFFASSQIDSQNSYCVVKKWKDHEGRNIIHIMDMFSSSDLSFRHMLQSLNSIFIDSSEINFWISNKSQKFSSLIEQGFVSIKKQPLIYKPLLQDFLGDFEDKNILFSYGDAEGY
jgi:hypothetical protein